MNLHALFEYRSGRVIAVFRAVLALVFLGAVLIEPMQRTSNLQAGKLLLGTYLLLSLALIGLAWRSWWHDQRLATAMLVIDVGVFLGAVYLTESSNSDFGSPFLALFALIVLSATLRWDWRVAARTGVIVTLLFVAAGFAMTAAQLPLDVFRFGRRAFYMAALLLVLVWFGIQRREPHVPPLALPDEGADDRAPDGRDLFERDSDAALWAALDYAMGLLGAPHGVLAWSDAEEPWIELRSIGPAGRSSRRVGPEALDGWESAAREVRVFDLARRRKLVRDGDRRTRPLAQTTPVPLGPEHGINEGLSLAFHAISGDGILVLGGINGLGPDYVTLGHVIASEIGRAFDRQSVIRFEREALVARTRSAIARDLHDSVAQSLAGACFRLEALRRAIHATLAGDGAGDGRGGADDEIVSVRDALRREQGHVRNLIESLRTPVQPPQRRDLHADLTVTLADAGTHWGIAAELASPAPADVPGWLSHEIQQLVREAVANAARHGHAARVQVDLAVDPRRVALTITDDGTGFDAAAQATRPWSISERVATLGGDLTVDSGTTGTRLAIAVPTGPVAGASA